MSDLTVQGLFIVFYMVQLQDVDKSVWVRYKHGLMTFYTSNYLFHFPKYKHTKEITQR